MIYVEFINNSCKHPSACHASTQVRVCGKKVMRYGHILRSVQVKNEKKKVRLGQLYVLTLNYFSHEHEMRIPQDVSISHDFLTPEAQELHAHEKRSSTRVGFFLFVKMNIFLLSSLVVLTQVLFNRAHMNIKLEHTSTNDKKIRFFAQAITEIFNFFPVT